jgi:small-conductance mechanosensitive channel
VLNHLAERIDDYRWAQPRTLPLFVMILKIIVVAGAAYGILLAFEVDVTAWLASAGIMGIAVGFAAKDTLANLFSGIFIVADTPYKLGDFIILSSGERGMVTDIGIRSTRLLTRDDIEITVPNAAIGNAKIVNETGGPHEKERVRIAVGVAYGTDIDRLREVLLEEAAKSVNLSHDPEPKVRFVAFGDSALEFQVRGWVEEPVLRGRAIDELNTAIYKRLAAEEIEIPFPQRVVHLDRATT